MRFGSLFTGVGGFDLGFERVGMTCAWQAENNKYSLQVLNNHWPAVRKYEDVRNVGRDAEAVNLICGGFPCQDLSVAGKRAGLAGERSGLWFEFRRIIEELRPTWVVIENVPGLLSSNGGRDFSVLLGGLAQLGYGWAYRVLDSQYFGVAQRRRRVFIVASPRGATDPAKVLFEPESRDWNTAPSREQGQGFTHPTSPSLRASGNGVAKASNERGQDPVVAVVGTLPASGAGTSRPTGQGNELDFVIPDWPAQTSPTINAHFGTKQGLENQHVDIGAGMFVPATWKLRAGKDGGGKGYLGQEQKPFALDTGNGQYMGVRRLTPVECERLQGFPDGWTNEQSDTQRYKMMGNAVTVNVIKWLGRRIMQVEGGLL